MAYIGYKKAAATAVVSKTLATMTGDGSDTTLTLSVTPGSVNNVCVCLDGVVQCPGLHFTLATNVITFATAPANGVEVIALSGGGEHIGSPSAGSIKSADLSAGAVTSSKIVSMDAAKLTGTYPALDASAVTGLTSANITGTFGALNASAVTGLTSANLTGTLAAVDGSALTGVPSSFTESASDPLITTNPSGGVGTIWINKTSGEVYACTDATTDANVWKNIGGGDGDVQPWIYQGSVSGYTAGGSIGSGASNNTTRIEKYSLVSASATGNVADLTYSKASTIGSCGETHSYWVEPGIASGAPIERTSYASDTHDSSLTALVSSGGATIAGGGAAEWSSKDYGYVLGGWRYAPANSDVNDVEKYSTVNDTNSTASGDLSETKSDPATSTDGSYGYAAGGKLSPLGASLRIERMSWATEVNSGSIGSLISGGHCVGGISSLTHGYINSASDISSGVIYTNFQKYAFASSGITTSSAATLANARGQNSVASSVTAGFIAKGANSSNSQTNQVKTFLFASDTTITDVGTLSQNGREAASSHT